MTWIVFEEKTHCAIQDLCEKVDWELNLAIVSRVDTPLADLCLPPTINLKSLSPRNESTSGRPAFPFCSLEEGIGGVPCGAALDRGYIGGFEDNGK